MKQSIGFNQFHDAFRDHDRLDNFSYEGLRVLFDFFEELDYCGEPESELDVIAICCEFSEADSDEIRDNYDLDSEWEFTDVLDHLHEHTMVCGHTDTGNIIYADF